MLRERDARQAAPLGREAGEARECFLRLALQEIDEADPHPCRVVPGADPHSAAHGLATLLEPAGGGELPTEESAGPQFITEIDGLDIHFIHVRSKHKNALPLIVTHGWPGSIIEQLKIIGPLTDPTAFGGRAEDAFDVVIPSIPGYGFSGKPTTTGWDPACIARAWVVLMKRLGYTRFVTQGGDWGAVITDVMAQQAPRNCSAFAPTWLALFHPTYQRRSRPAARRHLVCPTRRDARSKS
jgi:hypothetical protein